MGYSAEDNLTTGYSEYYGIQEDLPTGIHFPSNG